MMLMLGELCDDETLPYTFSQVNRTIFPSAYFGDAVQSYHCFLLAREERRKKGIVEASTETTDISEWLKWVFMSENTNRM